MKARARFCRWFITTAAPTGIVLGVLLAASPARAGDVQACLAASEKSQNARAAGKLREAREQLLICMAAGCPAIVRRDCAQWQADVTQVAPSVVFGAKDKQGRDLFEVSVSMDGELLVKRLDGKSVLVDAGPHTFTFETVGHPPVVERALVKEGEKTRVIAVTFGAEATAVLDRAGAAPPTAPPSSAERTPERGHTALPWVVVGVGTAALITGVVLLVTAPALPNGCAKTIQLCSKIPGESEQSMVDRQSQAARSENQPLLGLVVGGAGLGVAAGGLLWHFLEPTGASKSALRISPWAGTGASGILLDRSF